MVVVNPETAFRHAGIFEEVWKATRFISKLISVVWDEAHLITGWASFRPDLGEGNRLRNLIPGTIPFVLPSATMPQDVLNETISAMNLRRDRLLIFQRSNDRPNVYLTVRKIRHALSSFRDLEFLVPENWKPGIKIPRFVVFFDNIEESIKAAEVVRQRLPPEYRERIVWFNADNTPRFRERVTADFLNHKMFGLFCTDAFGMVCTVDFIDLCALIGNYL